MPPFKRVFKRKKNPIFLNSFLKFLNNDFSRQYDEETKHYTFVFIKFFLYSAVFHIFPLNISYLINGSYIKMIRVNIEGICFILALVFQNCFLKLSKTKLDLLFCISILLIYNAHIEFIISPYLKSSQDLEDSHYIFYIGVSLEILKIFIYVAKIKWFISYLTILTANLHLLLKYIVYSSFFVENLLITFLPIIVGSFILPLVMLFLKEKYEKNQFIKQKTTHKHCQSYENLIKNALPNPIFLLSSQKSQVFFCNDSARELFGIGNSEDLLKELSHVEITDGTGKKLSLLDLYQKRLNSSTMRSIELENYEGFFHKTKSILESNYNSPFLKDLSNEKTFYFDIKITNIDWRQEEAILIIINDTSPIFNCKKIKEVTDYKDQVLATFSHDLRSPLSGIVGNLEFARSLKYIDNEIKEIIQKALNSAKILYFLVNDIIDFSSLLKKNLKIASTNVQISEVVHEIVGLVDFQIKQKGIQFIFDVSKKVLNSFIDVDPQKIKQILLNLLTNAIKYTSKGFIKLSISLDALESTACFRIEDSGIGISQEVQETIFSFLERYQKKSNAQQAGLGFGLVISQALAKKICPFRKGLSCISSLGMGSTFQFKVKLLEESQSEIEIPLENVEITFGKIRKIRHFRSLLRKEDEITYLKHSLENSRVLLVDDDMINIMVHSQYLKKFRLNFDTAFNGKEAIEKIHENASKNSFYSVILMDCNMPIMDGFQATEAILEMIEKKQIPPLNIVAVTANASSSHKERCEKSGMNFFLEKPVSLDKMKETLESILDISIAD